MTCPNHSDRPVHARGLCRGCYDGERRGGVSRPSTAAEPFVEIPVIFRDYSHLEKLHVYPLGDVHKGARNHQQKRWREWLQYIEETPHASMLGTGDFFNAAIVGAKSDVYDEVMTTGEAKRELRAELKALATRRRIDLLIPGNHEDRITRAIGDCPVHDLADSLEVPHAHASALVVYTVGDHTYELFVRHGTGNGQSLVALFKGQATVPTADIFVTGHTHRQGVVPDDFFIREGDRLVRRHRYYVSSGSFLGLERYAAQRGYGPTRIGAPRIRLGGEHREIHVSV